MTHIQREGPWEGLGVRVHFSASLPPSSGLPLRGCRRGNVTSPQAESQGQEEADIRGPKLRSVSQQISVQNLPSSCSLCN